MKTTMLTKAMMAVLFAMTSVLTLNAAKPVKITNEEVENGRVSAKVVYEQEGTFLTPEHGYRPRRFPFKLRASLCLVLGQVLVSIYSEPKGQDSRYL